MTFRVISLTTCWSEGKCNKDSWSWHSLGTRADWRHCIIMSAFIYVQAKWLHPQNTSLTMCVCEGKKWKTDTDKLWQLYWRNSWGQSMKHMYLWHTKTLEITVSFWKIHWYFNIKENQCRQHNFVLVCVCKCICAHAHMCVCVCVCVCACVCLCVCLCVFVVIVAVETQCKQIQK